MSKHKCKIWDAKVGVKCYWNPTDATDKSDNDGYTMLLCRWNSSYFSCHIATIYFFIDRTHFMSTTQSKQSFL